MFLTSRFAWGLLPSKQILKATGVCKSMLHRDVGLLEKRGKECLLFASAGEHGPQFVFSAYFSSVIVKGTFKL